MTSEKGDNHWALDKRIPIALILGLMAQTGAGFYYFGKLENRVATLETLQARSSANGDRLTRLEVRLEGISQTLEKIDRKLESR